MNIGLWLVAVVDENNARSRRRKKCKAVIIWVMVDGIWAVSHPGWAKQPRSNNPTFQLFQLLSSNGGNSCFVSASYT